MPRKYGGSVIIVLILLSGILGKRSIHSPCNSVIFSERFIAAMIALEKVERGSSRAPLMLGVFLPKTGVFLP